MRPDRMPERRGAATASLTLSANVDTRPLCIISGLKIISEVSAFTSIIEA